MKWGEGDLLPSRYDCRQRAVKTGSKLGRRAEPPSGVEKARTPRLGGDHVLAACWGATRASQNNRKSWLPPDTDFGCCNSDAGDNSGPTPERDAAASQGCPHSQPSRRACSPPPRPRAQPRPGPHGPTAGRARPVPPADLASTGSFPRPNRFSPFRPGPAASPRRSPRRSTPAGSCQWPAPPPPSPPPSSLPPPSPRRRCRRRRRRQGRDSRNRARPAALPGKPLPPRPHLSQHRPRGILGVVVLPRHSPPGLLGDGAHCPGPWCGTLRGPSPAPGRAGGSAPRPTAAFTPSFALLVSSNAKRCPGRDGTGRERGGHLWSRWQSRVATTAEATRGPACPRCPWARGRRGLPGRGPPPAPPLG